MFEQNDKALLKARIIIIVFVCLFAAGSLIAGIVLAAVMKNGLYIFVALPGWFLCWLTGVFSRLYLSYLCDIKLIRNKLYGVSNDNLDAFIVGTKQLDQEEKKADLEEAKLALDELHASEAIDEEEYEKQKEELLKREKDMEEDK